MNHSALLAKGKGPLPGVSALLVPYWPQIICASTLGFALALPYFSALVSLGQLWLGGGRAYAHGFLVPLVSLYFVWLRREYLAQLAHRPSQVAGGVGLLASGVLLLMGRFTGIIHAEVIAFLLALPSIILFVLGWGYIRALALPLIYLSFMAPPAHLFFFVPQLEEFAERLHWPFQLISANIGVWTMHAVGFPALREGTFIYLPRITVEVAEACSGLQFLTSVIAIGIPLVYLTQRSWLRATTVVASGVVMAVLANGARVALGGIMATIYGAEMLHGPYKLLQGWIVAQVGIIGLFVVNWAVCKIPSRSATKLFERWKTAPVAWPARDDGNKAFIRRFAIVVLLLIGLGTYVNFFAAPTPIPLKRPLAEIPYSFAGWYGQQSSWFKGANYFPGVDASIARTYRTGSGREVHLFVGYVEFQAQGKSLVSYQAKPLHEGARIVPSGLDTPGPEWVNRSTFATGEHRYATLFWYRTAAGDLTGRQHVRLRAIVDAVAHRRNNGAVILLAAPLADGNMEDTVSKDLIAFAQDLAPRLGELLP